VKFVELKTNSGRLSLSQRHWLSVLQRASGVEVYVWRPNMEAEIKKILAA